jgi:hypothetical protein
VTRNVDVYRFSYLAARAAIPMRAAAAPTAVNRHSPHIIWPHGVRVALVGDEKQIGHEYVCSGSGSGRRLDRGTIGDVFVVTSMGDIGGAESGLGGGV